MNNTAKFTLAKDPDMIWNLSIGAIPVKWPDELKRDFYQPEWVLLRIDNKKNKNFIKFIEDEGLGYRNDNIFCIIKDETILSDRMLHLSNKHLLLEYFIKALDGFGIKAEIY